MLQDYHKIAYISVIFSIAILIKIGQSGTSSFIDDRYSCMKCDLTDIPDDIPVVAKEINLAFIQILTIPSKSFSNFTMLTALTLTGNSVLDIEPDAFYGLNSLECLLDLLI